MNYDGLNTKALLDFDWGHEWINSDGDLSVIVVVYEPSGFPIQLYEAFPERTFEIYDITNSVSERTLVPTVKEKLSNLQDEKCVITSHHAFIFNLIQGLNFRPDMFYIYSRRNGYRRLTECTPRELRKNQNYYKMYIAGTFDNEIE